jgi:hypothetical protein
MANPKYQAARKPTQTWLAGKVKCGRCGYALMSVKTPTDVRYFRCSKRAENKSCDGCGSLRTGEIEEFVYNHMVEKLRDFKGLPVKNSPGNPKLTAAQVELAYKVIELTNSLAAWNDTDFEDKRQMVDSIISIIRTTNENVEIE